MPSDRIRELRRRRFLRYSTAGVLSVTLAGCLGDDEDDILDDDDDDDDMVADDDDDDDDDTVEPQEYEIAITQRQDPTTLDPHDHRETTTDNVILHAYEGLLDRSPTGEIIPALAVEYEQIDTTQHRFHLREGVQFHEGGEFTAADAAFSIMRVRDDDVGNLASPQVDQIPGIIDTEVVDDYTVDVISGDANPMLFANLASNTPMVQEDWIMDNEPEFVAQNMNGTGPYRLDEFVDGEFTRFTSYEDYWDGEPPIDIVTIDAATEDATRVSSLRAGEIDLAEAVPPTDAPDIQADDDLRIESAPSTRIIKMPMVWNQEPFTSQEFRQAMNYAIDLDGIIEDVLLGFGDPTGQPTLEGYFGHNPDIEPYPFDPELAEQLIDDSGFAGAEIEIHNPTGRYLLNDPIAEAVVEMINNLPNVSCEFVPRDFGELAAQLLDGDPGTSPPFFLIGWGNSTFDAEPNLLPWYTEGTPLFTFVDEELEDLIFAATTETDPDTREQLLQDACALAHELAVDVFLHREFSVHGINNRVEWAEPRQDELMLAKGMSVVSQ